MRLIHSGGNESASQLANGAPTRRSNKPADVRVWTIADIPPHMSAFDPKRTSRERCRIDRGDHDAIFGPDATVKAVPDFLTAIKKAISPEKTHRIWVRATKRPVNRSCGGG